MPRSDAANQALREARREQIIGVAALVFAQQGLAGTKIGDIAAAAAMSQGLLYRYFATKEAVFAAAVRMLDEASARLCAQASVLPGTAREKLRWLTEQVLHIQYGMPAFALVIAHALTNAAVPDAVRAIALHQTETLYAALGAIIRDGQRSGELIAGHSDQLAMLYLGALHGLAVGGPLEAQRHADVLGIVQRTTVWRHPAGAAGVLTYCAPWPCPTRPAASGGRGRPAPRTPRGRWMTRRHVLQLLGTS